MEYEVKKLTIEEFYRESFRPEGPTLYEVHWGGYQYDLLLNYVPGSDRLVAMGSGTVARSKPLPVFHRISWADRIPVTTVFYADPSLYTGTLGLYWYYGKREQWLLENIAFLLFWIARKQEVSVDLSCFFGSSGGGYASVVLATLLRSRAAVINPQFILPNYIPEYYRRWFAAVVGKEGREVPERLDVSELFLREDYLPRIHCIENLLSPVDIADQLGVILRELCEKKVSCGDALSLEFYSHPGGHSAMPTQARSLDVLFQVLRSDRNGVDLGLAEDRRVPPFRRRLEAMDFEKPDVYLELEAQTYPSRVIRELAYRTGEGTLACDVRPGFPTEGYEFAYYLLRGEETVEKRSYTDALTCEFPVPGPGEYRVKVFVRFCGKIGFFLGPEIPL